MIQIKQTILNDKKKCDCGSTKIVEVVIQSSYTSMDRETAWDNVRNSEYYYCGECGIMKKFFKDATE